MKLILAISIALNVMLGALFLIRTNTEVKIAALPDRVDHSFKHIHVTTVSGATKPIRSLWYDDMDDLYHQLKAWGAPNDIILAVLFAKDQREVNQRRLEILYPKGMKRWGGPVNMTKEIQGQLADMYAERRAEIRKIMGDALDITIAEGDIAARIRWGNLTAPQIASVKRMTEEYETMKIKGRGISGANDSKSIAWERMMDDEYATDMRLLLGATQAEDFLTFNSFAAKNVQKRLAQAGLEVDEQTYRAVLKATNDVRAGFGNETFDDVYGRTAKQIEAYRIALGEDNALKLAKTYDANYPAFDALVANRPASDRYAFYVEYAGAMSRISQLQSTPTPQSRTEIAQEAKRIYGALLSRLSVNEVNQFINSKQGIFIKRWMEN